MAGLVNDAVVNDAAVDDAAHKLGRALTQCSVAAVVRFHDIVPALF